ncbi:hypothetical protein D3C80_958100 [compost metagenome]
MANMAPVGIAKSIRPPVRLMAPKFTYTSPPVATTRLLPAEMFRPSKFWLLMGPPPPTIRTELPARLRVVSAERMLLIGAPAAEKSSVSPPPLRVVSPL